MKIDPSLEPEWDDFNIMHIDRHGFVPEQIEEVYYGEGQYPSLNQGKKPMKKRSTISRKPKPQEVTELAEEAPAWDNELKQESLAAFEAKFAQAEPLETVRPTRHPVSVQLDQQDFILLKRCAQRQGVPYNRLVALWILERLRQEQKAS